MGKNLRKNRRYRQNVRRRERLVAQGYSEAEARAIVQADGRALMERHNALGRSYEDAPLRQELARADERFEVQPERPQSIRAVPTGFETSRRRH